MRILIVKLSSFGDVIHAFPALTDLKSARPEVEVDWLVEEAYAGLVRRHPGVSEVYPVALRRLRWPPWRWPGLLRHRAMLRRSLRARRYDLVLDVQGLMKSAILAKLAGAPVAGFDAATAREPAAARLYEKQIPLGGHPHIVEQNRRFFAAAVGYSMPKGKGQAGLTPPPRLSERPYGLLASGAAWPTKLWGEEEWRQLAERLSAAGERVVLSWGTPDEHARTVRIANGLPGIEPLPRRFSIDHLADLAANASFFVGLEPGLSHLAAAFSVPGVTLFGPTDPEHARPYGGRQRTVRSDHPEAPCQRVRCRRAASGRCCMDRIAVDAVWREVQAMLTEVVRST